MQGTCCLPPGYALATLPCRALISKVCRDKCGGLEVTYISPWCQRITSAIKTGHLATAIRTGHLATDEGIEYRIPTSQDDDSSNPDTRPAFELSANYNLPKCVIAIFQTLYASTTLYQIKGDKIQRYDYAAFGLTVAPYLLMSIINLLGTMLTPEYPCLYLVRSEVMDEASRREGAKFEGMVATLRRDPRKCGITSNSPWTKTIECLSATLGSR